MLDSHSHIYCDAFDEDREAAVQRAREAGVRHIVLPNENLESIPRLAAMRERYPDYVSMTVGLHPEDVHDNYLDVLNQMRLSDNVCAAINRTVDCEAIAAYLKGTPSAAVGPFIASAPYGQVTKPAPDPAAAKALLEADGYTLNADGYYEKDGKVLELSIAHYMSRQLPDLAVLMQEQLKNVGVKATPVVEEDPDATYIATGDYDIALYCMIADTGGDPYYCVDALYRQSGKWAKAGFPTDETEALINKLQFETDIDQRAALANEIVQKSIDDNAFGYVGLFNKVSVARPGVTGFSEDIPFDFYGLTADTDIA